MKHVSFLSIFFHFKGEEASVPAAPTVAVIGTENSPLTTELAAMLSLFKVPVLSYFSSSVSLDDKNTYPYFSRTVPSDKMQVLSLIHISEPTRRA